MKKIDLEKLDEMIGDNLQPVIDVFDLPWDAMEDKINYKCPLHGGDNQHSFYLNKSNDSAYWACFTGQCHRVFRGTMIGLVRGLLSIQHGWSKPGDTLYSFRKYA